MDFDDLKNKAKDLISSVTEGSTDRPEDADRNQVRDPHDELGGYTDQSGTLGQQGGLRDPAGGGIAEQPGSYGDQGGLRDPAGGGFGEQPGSYGDQGGLRDPAGGGFGEQSGSFGGVNRDVGEGPLGGYGDRADTGLAEQPGSFEDQAGGYQRPPGSEDELSGDRLGYGEGMGEDREGR